MDPPTETRTTLWMGDLTPWMDEQFIKQTWLSMGEAVNVKMIRDKVTGSAAGYCFVEFSSPTVAASLMEDLNGSPIPRSNRVFKLNWASGGGLSPCPKFSIFVGDLAPEVNDAMLMQAFQMYYTSVRSAKIVVDSVTKISKGYGFVRFGIEEEQQRSLVEMHGQLVSSRPIRVSVVTPKYNLLGVNSQGGYSTPFPGHPVSFVDSTGSIVSGQPHQHYGQPYLQHPHGSSDSTNSTVFIGALPTTMSEETLRNYFLPFGDIVYTKIPPGKGCGFVQFTHRKSAELAILKMDGVSIGKSSLRLSWGRSHNTASPVAFRHPQPYNIYPQFANYQYMAPSNPLIHHQVSQHIAHHPHLAIEQHIPHHLLHPAPLQHPHGMITYLPVHPLNTLGLQYIGNAPDHTLSMGMKEDGVERRDFVSCALTADISADHDGYPNWRETTSSRVASAAEDESYITQA
ncbi:hypothetical protein BASA50_010583 [Batrachochytrium salamandrivorans]|uniref:RRM domain-containing protein n=1 Tax=Batrachochytrium salamandrivorans TaxID=1357716 RepID=A0ABQ8EY06_9FUNG|nr:hypothetical protein BASA62_001727 [Batrachochytrium salamandrivorans]KAH6588622.1 hypothetical protein BASA50_010583 [Batrachochytrium salamandrivorans]KAH9269271.1 hypothetical protein BASA83_008633 [Batrachochytrium salamandrivorans]